MLKTRSVVKLSILDLVDRKIESLSESVPVFSFVMENTLLSQLTDNYLWA